MPAKVSKPNNYYKRGRDLVLGEYIQPGNVGEIPMFLHQTWKSELMQQDYVHSFDNWSKLHPGFLHVLWTDEDNDLLVKTWFPEFLSSYKWLPLVIQKTDFVRLMYLYRYGGIYADMDYVAYQPIPPFLPQLCGFMAVESPYILNECLQNSLMVTSPENQVVSAALDIINEAVIGLRNNVYKGLDVKNKFIGPLIATFITLYLTGPQVLDKAVSRLNTGTLKPVPQGGMRNFNPSSVHPASLESFQRADISVVKLSDQFFKGPVAAHLQHKTWVASLPKRCTPLILLTTGLLFLLLSIVVVVTFAATKHRKIKTHY